VSKEEAESAREVRAEVLARALTQSTDKQLFSLSGAKVLGKLNLRNCTIDRPVEIRDCEFEDEVDLRYCEFKQVVDFSGCTFLKEFNSGDEVEAHTVCKKDLICSKTDFKNAAKFNGISVEGGVYLSAAKFLSEKEVIDFSFASCSKSFQCEGATFAGGASFNSLRCDSSGIFNKAKFKGQGEVDFTGASFGRDLYCQGASFQGSVTFNSLKVDGDGRFDRLNGEDFKCTGRANFTEASFGVNLYFNEATFEGGASFNSLKCGENGFFNNAKFQGQGEVDFSYASLGRNLECNNATFGKGANFNRLTCEGNGSFSDAHFLGNGKVNIGFTRFGSNLDFSDAEFGESVDITATSISREFILTGAKFKREVVLHNASINVLVLEDPRRLRDDAFILDKHEEDATQRGSFYSKLLRKAKSALGTFRASDARRAMVSWKESLDLRECTFNRFRGPDEQASYIAQAQDPLKFSQDPYLQLEKYYESMGNDAQARKTYYQGRLALRENAKDKDSGAKWTLSRKLTDWLLKWLTGYGVRTWRLLVPISIFIILGMFMFWSEDALLPKVTATPNGTSASAVISPTSDQPGPRQSSSDSFVRHFFDRATFSVGRFLPLVNLRVADKWEPHGLGREAYVFVHSLVGWILVPLLIASLAGIIRRR
jgi:hypothetical protein